MLTGENPNSTDMWITLRVASLVYLQKLKIQTKKKNSLFSCPYSWSLIHIKFTQNCTTCADEFMNQYAQVCFFEITLSKWFLYLKIGNAMGIWNWSHKKRTVQIIGKKIIFINHDFKGCTDFQDFCSFCRPLFLTDNTNVWPPLQFYKIYIYWQFVLRIKMNKSKKFWSYYQVFPPPSLYHQKILFCCILFYFLFGIC